MLWWCFDMENAVLEVRMLGGFSLRRGERTLELGGRSRKLYLLLAYLLRERGRNIPCAELAGVLWPGEELDDGLRGALKTILHRARACLDELGEGLGKSIISRRGCFRWDPAVPVALDAEEFSRLCQEGDRWKKSRPAAWLRALALYRGDFLPAAGACAWAAEQAAPLHQLWLRVVLDTLPLLAGKGQWAHAAALSEEALLLEPCHEGLCRRRMEALLALGRKREAVQAYEGLQEHLLAQTGLLPSDELRELCRAARDDPDPRRFTPAELPRRLREPPTAGALLCEFDFFRILCFSMARLAQRSGQALHAALLSMGSAGDAPLAPYSRDRAMNNLQAVLLNNLRRGDAAARCSASQFVLLLPQAGYADAQMVCRRLWRAFHRQYPHSPACVSFAVLPLTEADSPAPQEELLEPQEVQEPREADGTTD